jgi:hypothetical protein
MNSQLSSMFYLLMFLCDCDWGYHLYSLITPSIPIVRFFSDLDLNIQFLTGSFLSRAHLDIEKTHGESRCASELRGTASLVGKRGHNFLAPPCT